MVGFFLFMKREKKQINEKKENKLFAVLFENCK